MRSLLSACLLVLLALVACLAPTERFSAPALAEIAPSTQNSLRAVPAGSRPLLIAAYHNESSDTLAEMGSADDEGGGIKELVPDKYQARYQQWKAAFLDTEMGHREWAIYEHNPNFALTIVVARDNPEGAGTGKYKWDESGKLIAATITLGTRLNEGYPNPIYYPVMNSLTPNPSSFAVNEDTLAAAKIAHEFGHLTRTAKTDATLYQLQSQLMPVYNKILLSNGRNANDPRLVEVAKQIGGTPVEIWEDREYWGEANAMMFLRDRFTEENLRCPLFSRIRRSVDLYAKSYEVRFQEIAQSKPSRRTCGWQ
jgi:YD repeat-containing protein